MATQPFRFLDLPPELRLTVYEQIDLTTTMHEIKQSDAGCEHWKTVPNHDSTITMARKSVETSLLATCRLIKQEASSIFKAKFSQLRTEPVKFRLDWIAAAALLKFNSALQPCFHLRLSPRPERTEIVEAEPVKSFTKRSLLLTRHLRCSGYYNVEITISDHDDSAAHGVEVLETMLQCLTTSTSWGLSVRLIHHGLPSMTINDRLYSASQIAQIFEHRKSQFVQRVLNKPSVRRRRCHVLMQELGDKEWARHNEIWPCGGTNALRELPSATIVC